MGGRHTMQIAIFAILDCNWCSSSGEITYLICNITPQKSKILKNHSTFWLGTLHSIWPSAKLDGHSNCRGDIMIYIYISIPQAIPCGWRLI